MSSHPRFSLRQQASIRDHIDAVRLVKFLQDHATKVRKKKVDPSRVKAAEVLLRKVLPDLQTVALQNPDGTNLNFTLSVPPKNGTLGSDRKTS